MPIKPKKPKESIIENYLIEKCKEQNIFILKNTGMRGIPDRLLIKNGIHIFIETKRPGEKTRKLQEAIIAKLQKHGAIALTADTKEKIDDALKLFDDSNKNSNKERNKKI